MRPTVTFCYHVLSLSPSFLLFFVLPASPIYSLPTLLYVAKNMLSSRTAPPWDITPQGQLRTTSNETGK